ncbi:Ankyrin repeat family, partial [Trichomonas vaginalis G3]|uniref:Ankyrin repeat family n=1 Tax=Trichomonas vaginalis (strain ATCC PRA-98 / G3) TaxID=412133 RepID=UPI0021E56041
MEWVVKYIIENNPEALVELSKIRVRTHRQIPCDFEGQILDLHQPLPLHLAIFLGRKEIIDALIYVGANINEIDPNSKCSPLHIAAYANDIYTTRVLV